MLVLLEIATGTDSAYGRLLRSFPGDYEGISSVAFSPNGQHILSVDDRGLMILWDAETAQEINSYSGVMPGSEVVFSPDSNYIPENSLKVRENLINP